MNVQFGRTKQQTGCDGPNVPRVALSQVELTSVQEHPGAAPMLNVPMAASVSPLEHKVDRKKALGGFRMAVGRVTKIFSGNRKKKVDIAPAYQSAWTP